MEEGVVGGWGSGSQTAKRREVLETSKRATRVKTVRWETRELCRSQRHWGRRLTALSFRLVRRRLYSLINTTTLPLRLTTPPSFSFLPGAPSPYGRIPSVLPSFSPSLLSRSAAAAFSRTGFPSRALPRSVRVYSVGILPRARARINVWLAESLRLVVGVVASGLLATGRELLEWTRIHFIYRVGDIAACIGFSC